MNANAMELHVIPKSGPDYKVLFAEVPQDINAWVAEHLRSVARFEVNETTSNPVKVAQVVLNRIRHDVYLRYEVYTDVFLYSGTEETDEGIETALRKAVLNYLVGTVAAEKELAYACNDYNWGDWVCGNWDSETKEFERMYEGDSSALRGKVITRVVSIDVNQDEWPCDGVDTTIEGKVILVHADGTEEELPDLFLSVNLRSGYVDLAWPDDIIAVKDDERLFVEFQNCGVRHALRSQSGKWNVDDLAAFFKTE